MNILIVSDQFLRGGLEEQIVNHVKTFEKYHKFSFAFAKYEDREFFKEHDVYKTLKCGPAMSIGDVINDVDEICRIIKKESIDLIEVHPFYAFLPVMIAANRCNVPVVHLVHGAPSIVFDIRLNMLMLHRFFLMDFVSCVVTPNKLFEHTLREQYSVSELRFAPNTIDMREYSGVRYNPKGKFVLFSRLDKDKYIQVKKAIDCAKLLDLKVDIYGGGSYLSRLEKYAAEKDVEFKGWTNSVPEVLKNGDYAGVIGGSRVALEGLAANLPTLLIGWDKISGFIDVRMYNKIKNYNTSNRSLREITNDELKNQFSKLQIKPNDFRLRKLARKDFDNSVLIDVFSDVFAVASRETNYFDLLDVLYDELRKISVCGSDEIFFNSELVSDLLEKIFLGQFITNPLIVDLLCQQRLKKEIEMLCGDLYASSACIKDIQNTQEQMDSIKEQLEENSFRIGTLEDRKTILGRSVDKIVHIVKHD